MLRIVHCIRQSTENIRRIITLFSMQPFQRKEIRAVHLLADRIVTAEM